MQLVNRVTCLENSYENKPKCRFILHPSTFSPHSHVMTISILLFQTQDMCLKVEQDPQSTHTSVCYGLSDLSIIVEKVNSATEAAAAKGVWCDVSCVMGKRWVNTHTYTHSHQTDIHLSQISVDFPSIIHKYASLHISRYQ